MQMSARALQKQQQQNGKRQRQGVVGCWVMMRKESHRKKASEKKEHKAKTITRKRLFMVTLSRKDKPRRKKKTETNKYAQNVYPIYLDKSTAKWH